MNQKNFSASLCLVIFVLFATMVGCSSKDERSEQVIERRSSISTSTSTSTTVESPVIQERKTTTTTTTELPVLQEKRTSTSTTTETQY